MARTPSILYIGQPGNTDTDLYTVPASTKATITSISACNTNASTKWITFHLVQSGDSVADDVAIRKMIKLLGTGSSTGGGEYTREVPIQLAAAGKISAIQETATAITVTIFGFTEPV